MRGPPPITGSACAASATVHVSTALHPVFCRMLSTVGRRAPRTPSARRMIAIAGSAVVAPSQADAGEQAAADQPADHEHRQRGAEAERRHQRRAGDDADEADAEVRPERALVEEPEDPSLGGNRLDAVGRGELQRNATCGSLLSQDDRRPPRASPRGTKGRASVVPVGV